MKSRSHFKFRQFSVADDQCSMKVGTDAVLLAAWADVGKATRILDIGTGSGVIALIAAQRTTAHCRIDGVEIQLADSAQASANVAGSPWSERIKINHSAIQDFQPSYLYDVILCNPPYFINSLRSPAHGRTTARHTVSLDHATLIATVERLLAPTGTASFIMPPEEGEQFRMAMETGGMHTTRLCRFRTREGKKVERLLMSFARAAVVTHDPVATNSTSICDSPVGTAEVQAAELRQSDLLLYGDGERWTREYTELTRDLYLDRP